MIRGLSDREKIILLFVLFALFTGLLYSHVYLPQIEKRYEINADIQEMEYEIILKQRELMHEEEIKQEKERLEYEINKFLLQIPSRDDFEFYFILLNRLAEKSNLHFISGSKQSLRESELARDLLKKSFTVRMTGSYSGLLSFFSHIENNPQVMIVPESMNLSSGSNGDEFSVELALEGIIRGEDGPGSAVPVVDPGDIALDNYFVDLDIWNPFIEYRPDEEDQDDLQVDLVRSERIKDLLDAENLENDLIKQRLSLVEKEDILPEIIFPQVDLIGIISSGGQMLAVMETKSDNLMVDSGDRIDGWMVDKISDSYVAFTKDKALYQIQLKRE